jgi:hypothetical protein
LVWVILTGDIRSNPSLLDGPHAALVAELVPGGFPHATLAARPQLPRTLARIR